MEFTLSFMRLFLWGIYLISPILIFFMVLIFALGQIAGRIEGWKRFNTFYWSFITAMTVGYGDIHPTRKSSRTISILIALLGVMFTGVIVAITVTSATEAFKRHIHTDSRIESIKKTIGSHNHLKQLKP